MGWWNSRIEKAEVVVRCKARKSYMKHFVKARQALSGAHSMYLRSLRNTGSALLQFVAAEAKLHHHHHLPPSPRISKMSGPALSPPPPPPMSHSSPTWTNSTTTNPPPPPPPVSSSVWDFFDPFFYTSGRTEFDQEWEDTTTVSVASVVAPPPSGVSEYSKDNTSTTTTTTAAGAENEVAQVESTKIKEIEEIMKELDECFLKAADSGGPPSLLLEVPTCAFPDQKSSGKFNLAKWNAFGNFCEQSNVITNVGGHGSTLERLHVWEKKLYLEVKNAETLKLERVKKSDQLKKLELKKADNIKTETAKKELEKLESRMLFSMWKSMYECHHEQTVIVQQLKHLNAIPSSAPTSEIHRQSAVQLELQVQQWFLSLNNLVKAQRDYVQSLTGWLRLSLFQVGSKPIQKSDQDSAMYLLCEEWQLVVNNAQDKVASEGLQSLYTVIHAIVLQQAEEFTQKKKSEATFKQLERKNAQLRELESKYAHSTVESSAKNRNSVREKRAKVETLRVKAEEEKSRYDKLLNVTRTMTVNNLQMGLPHLFQAVTGFANAYTHGFEPVYNQAKSIGV
ncbi:hypothetical protein Leryth_018276 [Lithospermum erythrorhizon]|nr:hypothetical protein Leryth_018276 [Lithospermum erythrorhizon]